MTTAAWMVCVVTGGLLAGVACAVAMPAIGAWMSERRRE